MTHWLDVFLFEARQQFSRKAYLFVTFGVPLLAILAFFGYQAYRDATRSNDEPAAPLTKANESDKSIGYVDLTPDGLFPAPDSYPDLNCAPTPDETQALLAATGSSDLRSAVVKRISSPRCLAGAITYYATLDDGKRALDNGDIKALYAVEPDFAATGNLSVYVGGFSIGAMESGQIMEDYALRSALYQVEASDYEALYLRLRDPAFVVEHKLTETGGVETKNENRNFLLVYAFGLIMMMTIFWGGGYLMQSAVQEKESRIVEIVLSSIRPTALLTGKILAMGLLSLVQVAMLIGTFVFIVSHAGNIVAEIGDIQIEGYKLALMGVYFVLGYLLFGSLMAAIGAISTTVRESQNFVVLVTLPATIPLFFTTIFAEEPDSSLPTTLSLIPFTSPLSMTMRLAASHVSVGEVALSLGLLIGGVAFTIWLAGRLFRVNTLLMGHTPRLRDLPKLVRG
jgi:ABC-2 type transport system permease protein